MTSAVIGIEGRSLNLGHQVIDTASGRPVTWVHETIALPDPIPAAVRDKLAALASAWPGPEIPAPSARLPDQGAVTARDRVKPWEIDERGRLALPDFVHRFSGAGMHFLTSVDMTGEYMQKNRRGFSTFLLDVEIASEAKAGERIDVRTAPAHLGNTSLKYVHTMTGSDGRLVASMVQAGVQLDLDARRPTAFPADIRTAIQSRLAG
jgi:acyl-CoA thioesterase FadM